MLQINLNQATKAKLDIIIVNHNSTDCLINCLKSIKLNLGDIASHIIVQDNASNDRPDRINALFSDVTLVLNQKNIGFAKAVNNALSISHSDLVVLLNPDTLVMKGFFKKVRGFLNSSTDIGIIGPKIIEANGEIQGSTRNYPTPLTTLFGRRSPLTRLFPNNSITRKNILTLSHDGRTEMDVEWVSGACMIARREALSDVNGFDERFFLYWEDTDLCKRIREKSWRVVYLPKAKVVHLTGKSSSTKPIFSIYHFHRSCYQLFKKHAKKPIRYLMPIAFIGLSMRALFTAVFTYTSKFINLEQFLYVQRDKSLSSDNGSGTGSLVRIIQLNANKKRSQFNNGKITNIDNGDESLYSPDDVEKRRHEIYPIN